MADMDVVGTLYGIYADRSALLMFPNGIRQVALISVLFLDSVKSLSGKRRFGGADLSRMEMRNWFYW